MSLGKVADPPQVDADADAANTDPSPKASHKSFRRKYRKMMVKFEETMRQSTALFKDEQRILDLSQRLAEQNDQILELLSELNCCPQIPPDLRFDLTLGSPAESTLASLKTFDALSAQETLKRARQRLRDGEMMISEYNQLQDAILGSPAFAPQRSYTSLLKVPHTLTGPRYDSTNEITNKASSGYLTVPQEDQYLEGLDSFLDGKSAVSRPHAASNLGARSTEKSAEREREMQLRNPVSVYNWLRKHQPQVFLQDHEPHSEKPPRPAGSRASKRAPTTSNSLVKHENDFYDDEGIAVDAGHSSRGNANVLMMIRVTDRRAEIVGHLRGREMTDFLLPRNPKGTLPQTPDSLYS